MGEQEPSQEQRVALEEKRKELGTPETEMACWLLETLAQVADADYAKRVLYRRDTLETLLRYKSGGGELGRGCSLSCVVLVAVTCTVERDESFDGYLVIDVRH